jgi:hypothetical protein
MRIKVKCLAVVVQGVEKILIHTIDDLATPEEDMILNLVKSRGMDWEIDAEYEIIINKVS